ncbi:MauE/DoxX family redox-associated membrane protein [Micromonospora andamanensis]|uniref:Methylamine utilisation protein MauE domain-containing protein n=1 Tax=Micromonospora andamanensis TaxID=1287068 RepID=A0ABQ4I298_9ACTN|nr:MauE/DoxX family redox-associated membrane protein [Micromonospora andamanensis]GIJ11931.1 hypothetical protein Van01_51450 [Micromonospora andamanensis]GIJ42172.1 hypothetical protein Vwe01_54970 [Micromonospora andamanensis]
MSYLIVGGRLLVAGIFLLSLFGKVRSAAQFRRFVAATAGLLAVRPRWARPLALATVGAEATIVALALAPVGPVAGFVLAGALLTCFTVALVRARRRADQVACHCFGQSQVPVGHRHVVRNVVLIFVVLLLAAAAVATTAGPVDPAGVAVAALVAVPTALAIAHLDDVVDVLRPSSRK